MVDPFSIHPKTATKNTKKNPQASLIDNISHFMETVLTELRLNDHLHRRDERTGPEWRAVKDSLERLHRTWSVQKSLIESKSTRRLRE